MDTGGTAAVPTPPSVFGDVILMSTAELDSPPEAAQVTDSSAPISIRSSLWAELAFQPCPRTETPTTAN